VDAKLLEILVCPLCNGKLDHQKTQAELICHKCKLAYPIDDGIPVMLIDSARKFEDE
jgi:uncharacterized protein YbaR (Trm112 family)